MISFDTHDDTIICYADDEDIPTTPEKIVEAIANSIDLDFVNLENEGAPVYFGNSYAEYQVRILLPKFDSNEHIIGIGPNEAEMLNQKKQIQLTITE